MKFVDEYSFSAQAGSGGNGVVRWRREKFIPKGGPCGGNGGKGGNVVVRAIRDINKLSRISHVASYQAENGVEGGSNSKTGRNGEDLVLELPVGSVITNNSTGFAIELLHDGEERVLLTGGAGGLGNEHFKSASNQAPRECTKGAPGEEGSFHVEMKLIADVGLVGLPNAGKSSLLNALTNADAKVGDYAFTTLDPNLGVFYGTVLADIPGLIEGAHDGKGLGIKFLRHISRTRLILHCISLEQENPLAAYSTVRGELESYPGLNEKEELLLLTKSDMVREEELEHARSVFKATGKNVMDVTVLDDESVKRLRDYLVQEMRLHEEE
jgi:GTP-binding protein